MQDLLPTLSRQTGCASLQQVQKKGHVLKVQIYMQHAADHLSVCVCKQLQ